LLSRMLCGAESGERSEPQPPPAESEMSRAAGPLPPRSGKNKTKNKKSDSPVGEKPCPGGQINPFAEGDSPPPEGKNKTNSEKTSYPSHARV